MGVAAYSQEKPKIVKLVDSRPVGSMTFVATAYSLKGKMANGQTVHSGAIAADPKVLPIGSVVMIENMGIFTVKDTGGAIKGNRIDIWMPSRKQALKFGRRKVHVLKIKKRN